MTRSKIHVSLFFMESEQKTIHNSSLKSRELRAKLALEIALAELSRNEVSESEAINKVNQSIRELSNV